MDVKIKLFKENQAGDLSKMLNETISQLEKDNPQIDYGLVRKEDSPEELSKAGKLGTIWVAELEGRIVGTISLLSGRVRRFFVYPNYQGQGIGKKLMQTLTRFAENNKIKKIWAGAIMSACPIYRKLGFREEKRFFNPEINQEEVKMIKELK